MLEWTPNSMNLQPARFQMASSDLDPLNADLVEREGVLQRYCRILPAPLMMDNSTNFDPVRMPGLKPTP